mmetsp:Transcript_33673/g.73687  ORF Transcript_33673/g.73687 Transcript_33673/m.73687 type:complete len:267 (-) Transcript_33673:120-920(-)
MASSELGQEQPEEPAGARGEDGRLTPVLDIDGVIIDLGGTEDAAAEDSAMAAGARAGAMASASPRREPSVYFCPSYYHSFEIRVLSENGCLGVDVRISRFDNTLKVDKVKEGPILRWNESWDKDDERGVRNADKIACVNGKFGNYNELLQVVRSDRYLDMTIWRRAEYRISISKFVTARGEVPIGLRLAKSLDDTKLAVKEVSEGPSLISAWNENARMRCLDAQVYARDIIIEVNGIRSDAGQMMERLRSDPHLSILLRRPKPALE